MKASLNKVDESPSMSVIVSVTGKVPIPVYSYSGFASVEFKGVSPKFHWYVAMPLPTVPLNVNCTFSPMVKLVEFAE
jgi:hypothetical protein